MKSLAITPSSPTVLPVIQPSENDDEAAQSNPVPPKKDLRFFLILVSMCICMSLSALELSSVSTALPTIASHLHTSTYTWVGSAYTLASTASLPMSGGLAQTFGRRPAVLVSVGAFALGSGICGAANSMAMLIAGRVIQGFGAGAVQSLTGIVLSDLVTLRERGIYIGIYAFMWCISMSIGPIIGGSLAARGQWRWLFYLDLVLSLVAWASVILLLDLPTPSASYRDKFMRMDWIGNFLMISSTTACTVGLTWDDITVPWDSATVLVPLLLGLAGLGVFVAYEAIFAKYPLVPFSLITNLTSLSGYLQTACSFIIISAVIYYFPVYFMACKGASSMLSGIYLLGFTSLAPAAIITGFSVKATGRYRLQMWIGWTFTIVALSLMNTIRVTDSIGESMGFLALLGCGAGMLIGTSLYPIQAPLPVTLNAHSSAFTWFLRSFASMLGISIGNTVLQNQLVKMLPSSLVQSIPQGTGIIYAIIPMLSTLPLQTQSEAQVAYASSLASLWRILAAFGGAGLVSSFFMRGLLLHDKLDAEWVLMEKEVAQSTCEHSEVAKTDVLVGAAGAGREGALDISAIAGERPKD